MRDALGFVPRPFMAFGRADDDDATEDFCMTVLALKLSHRANAVSSLHGHVSRAMWTSLFPGVREEHVPIGHVTNGVHVKSWLAPQMKQLYDRHLGVDWLARGSEPAGWDHVDDIDDGELWETRQTLKAQLIAAARRRAAMHAARRHEPAAAVAALARALRPDALPIRFARRFATYKRANLVLQALEAVASRVKQPQIPGHFSSPGKAHPLSMPGKNVRQHIRH